MIDRFSAFFSDVFTEIVNAFDVVWSGVKDIVRGIARLFARSDHKSSKPSFRSRWRGE